MSHTKSNQGAAAEVGAIREQVPRERSERDTCIMYCTTCMMVQKPDWKQLD